MEVELLLPEGMDSLSTEEYIALITTAPVRLTDTRTGLSAVGKGCGNQVKNKAKALDLLTEQLKLEKE